MTVLGVCGGNGVILHPFKEYLIANLEPRAIFHSKNNEQWYKNFNVPIHKKEENIYRSICRSRVEVIIGAPDCGHSSILALSRGKKMTDPKDNSSLMMFFRAITYYKPKVWLMENLPAMLKNITRSWLLEQFPKYSFDFIEEPVTYFGNSQTSRKRLVIVAVRQGKDVGYILRNISKVPKKKIIKNVKDLLEGLGKDNIATGNVREELTKMISLYIGSKNRISVKKAKRLWSRRFKDSRRWVVNRERMKNQPGVYRNLSDRPPLTATKGDRQFRPDGLPMSPRELARIQGIPDDFKIFIHPDNSQYWINKGRATVGKSPPYEIGLWFYKALFH